MSQKHKVLFITIVPSPYQRDLFTALAARPDVDLEVCYLEAASPDSPWPEKPLRPFERVLPGFWIPLGDARAHLNWALPDVSKPDVVVLSSFTSLTGQWLMRHALGNKRWLFWGERLHRNCGLKATIQGALAAPIAHASGIVGIGRAAEADYRRRFPQVPHFCIPYHCDLSGFFDIPRYNQVAAPTTFLFCGQMIRRKGIDLLLQAFDRLIGTGLDANLLLVGRSADLPVFLETMNPVARSKIRYEGFKAPECLPECFARADVLVLPSRHEGWGVVVNQAMAASMPIIASDAVGAGLDLVENGVNGVAVPTGDVNALQGTMEILVRNPGLIGKWGEQSRKKAYDLTPDAGARKWIHVFESLSPA
jgi:glycosyltransferase involved in cell wall biosynthesis